MTISKQFLVGFLLVLASSMLFGACTGAATLDISEDVSNPAVTRLTLEEMAQQLSIPEYAIPVLSQGDIDYGYDLLRIRTQTERDSYHFDCYDYTLGSDIHYYRDEIDLPSHTLAMDVPIGWTKNRADSPSPRLKKFAHIGDVFETNLAMAQNCEPFVPISHPTRGGTFINIIPDAKAETIDWLTDQSGETWRVERESLETSHTHVTLLSSEEFDYPGTGTAIIAVESIELDRDSFGYLCCNETRPHHYAFIEIDNFRYVVHMLETEGSRSREAFAHMLQSMEFTPKAQ